MVIRLSMPENGPFSVTDIFDIVDFATTRATVFAFTSTEFSGTGSYHGVTGNFDIVGTGFSISVIGGESYVTSGILNELDFWTGAFTSEDDLVHVSSLNIDMSVFASIVFADEIGSAPLGIENFLLSKAWDITLGNQDDVAGKGLLIGDGADFNLKGNDTIRGMGGNDKLFSGDGDDRLFGNTGRDILNGGNGNDIVKGGNGFDRISGGNGRDKLFGDAGNDKLKGGDGKDVLIGGEGNDVLTGGKGLDRFVFKDGSGHDKITDFNATKNLEDIDLRAVTEITGFVDLKNHHMSQVDTNVVIDDGAGVEIILVGVDIADLHKADFIF